jgi:hypothetical protein
MTGGSGRAEGIIKAAKGAENGAEQAAEEILIGKPASVAREAGRHLLRYL